MVGGVSEFQGRERKAHEIERKAHGCCAVGGFSRLNHRSEASVLAILPKVPILPDLLKLLDSASILG